MPELPEVEVVVRALRAAIIDKVVAEAVINGVNDRSLQGQKVVAVTRRAKYICVELEHKSLLVMHLRLTGIISLQPPTAGFEKAYLTFVDGSMMSLTDARGFATSEVLTAAAAETKFAKLSHEPIDKRFTAAYLSEKIKNKRVGIKSALLDQSIAAGVGNIYADEALWHTRIHPQTPAKQLTADEVKLLSTALSTILNDSIAAGSSSVNSYQHIDGTLGTYQNQLQAYGRGRKGLPCPRCQTAMSFTKVGGRGTSYCSACQKIPKI